jgi:hypothetical protein
MGGTSGGIALTTFVFTKAELEWEKERGRGVCFPAPHCFAADDFLGNNPDPEEIFGFTRYRDFR